MKLALEDDKERAVLDSFGFDEDDEEVGAVLECSMGSFLMIFFGPMVR